MIHNLKPYPAYKDSGVSWLGEIPNTWKVLRGKNVFRVVDIKSKTGNEELLTVSSKDGVVPRSQKTVTMFKAESYVGHKLCWPGDLVINSLWAWMQGLGFTKYYGLVSSAYSVYRPLQKFCSYTKYFDYTLRSAAYKWELQTRSKGVWLSRLQLSDLAFFDMPIIIPPADEQLAIVHYLDYIDRRIRRYIRAKQKLIKLLEEQKQAIIHQAVTRGLDPNVKLKPSGIEWLGNIPEHWEVKRLKWVTRLQRGFDLPQDQRKPGLVPVVSSGGIIDTHYESRSKGPGVVMGRYGSTDSVFFIEEDFWPHNTSLFVTDFQENDRKWCFYLLRTISKADHSSKSAVPGVDRKDLYEIRVTQPPFNEQINIVHVLEENLKTFNMTIDNVNREISLLREYRTRLIADVVTGKLDVREAVKNLPEETDETEVFEEALARYEEAIEEDLDIEPEGIEA